MRAQYCSTGRRIPVLEDRQIDRWVETREMDSQTVRLSMDNKEDRYYYHHLTLPYHFCYLPLPYVYSTSTSTVPTTSTTLTALTRIARGNTRVVFNKPGWRQHNNHPRLTSHRAARFASRSSTFISFHSMCCLLSPPVIGSKDITLATFLATAN